MASTNSRNRRSRFRAHTILEISIASALLLMLMASCTVALRMAMQYQRRISEQTEMESSLIMAMESLYRDGSETSIASVAWSPAPPEGPSLTFLLPRNSGGELLIDHDNGNKLLFGSVVSYRVAGDDKQLRRYVDFFDPPTGSASHPIDMLTPPRDAAFYSDPAREYKTLATGVVNFSLVPVKVNEDGTEKKGSIPIGQSKILRVSLELERRFQRTYGIEMEIDIVPRN